MQALSEQTTYRCITILGKTEEESQQLYAKQQWMQLYLLLDAFFKMQQLQASVVSYQMNMQIKKIDKKGNWNISPKNVPTGGVQKWSQKANEKICGTEMESHFERLKQLSNEGLTLQKYIDKNFPAVDSYFEFNETQVYAYLDADVNVKHQPQGDFHLYLHRSLSPHNKVWNQEIDILFSDRLMQKASTEIEELVKQIGALSFAVRIAKTDFRASKTIDTDYGGKAIVAVFGRRYGKLNSLNLTKYKDLQLSDWTDL